MQAPLHLSLTGLDVAPRVLAFTGSEEVGSPYRFDIELAFDQCPDLDTMIGETVALTCSREGRVERVFTGMVIRAAEKRLSALGENIVELEIVPRAFRAEYVKNIRVHTKVDIRALIRHQLTMLALEEGVDFELRLDDPPTPRDLIVQYRETDQAFLHRLLERAGIASFYVPGRERETLVLTDHPSGFDVDDAPLRHRLKGEQMDVYELLHERNLTQRVFVCRDYSPLNPAFNLQSDAVANDDGDLGGTFDFGFGNTSVAEANAEAKRMADRANMRRDTYRGRSDLLHLRAGCRYSVADYKLSSELLLVAVRHRCFLPESAEGAVYENEFEAIPAERMARPIARTPAPRIPGLLHAVVLTDATGAVGKKADLDSSGGYLVKFRFDPAPPGDVDTTVRVRMIQPSAGPSYGIHFPLRPGVEVLVGFIGGDPERPIIVGAAPNAITPSPVSKVNASKNRIRTANGAMIEFDDGT